MIKEDLFLIELEIIRMKIHYKIFKLLKELMRNNGYNLGLKELQQLLLRYILNKNADINLKREKDESVFIVGDSELANKQLSMDVRFYNMEYKMYKLIKDLLDSAFIYANDTINGLKDENKIERDKEIKVKQINKNKVLIYESNTLVKITDNYIKIYDNKIEMIYFSKNKYNLNNKYVFCALLRYKYLFIDAHGSQLEYKEAIENFKDLDLNEATECFASPFNHTFNYYCSAFEDLEKPLGSLGNFFRIEKFPTKILFVNPVFDPVFMSLTIQHILNLMEKNKYMVYFILPVWKRVSYKLLYDSKYFVKKKLFPKGELFFYNFPTGRKYSPCSIEVILLDNSKKK